MGTTLGAVSSGLSQTLAASALTRSELAARAGVSRTTLRKVLEGEDYRVSTLLAVADRLGLEVALVPRGLAPALEAGGLPGGTPGPAAAISGEQGSLVGDALARLRAGVGGRGGR